MKVPGRHPARARALLAIAFLAMALLSACSSGPLPFQGTALSASPQATPFQLQDQSGNSVSLADFRGKVVLLTFLYTNCPDVCPITASQLRAAYGMLGEDVKDVAFVAISVDPERDDMEAARKFSDKWGMTGRWSYLVGDEEELRPIWEAYYIDPAVLSGDGQDASPTPPPHGAVDALVQESYQVIHSSPVYVIDQQGRMRAVFTLPFDTQDLVHDARLLLG